MTFEQVLAKYLYQHKRVTLAGIGTLTLSQDVPDNDFIRKNSPIRVEGISLASNPRAGLDEGFVSFFSAERGKIKPLAQSDIESKLQLSVQMMNIGTPYEIEGVGRIEKQNNGLFIVHPGFYVVPYADNLQVPGKLKERAQESDQQGGKKLNNTGSINEGAKRQALILAVVIIVAVFGWFLYSQLKSPAGSPATEITPADSLQNEALGTTIEDSALLKPDSAVLVAAPASVAPTDTNGEVIWKAYIRSYTNKNAALQSFEKFKTYSTKPYLETSDSINFKIYILVNSKIEDSAFVADSLRGWYASKVTLVKKS